jgi:hypothetical protein
MLNIFCCGLKTPLTIKLLTVILLLLLHSHGATIAANASNPTLHQAQGPTAT